jgi:hypothetical protein
MARGRGASQELAFRLASVKVRAVTALRGRPKRRLLADRAILTLPEEFAGADSGLYFATAESSLERFRLASLKELTAASVSANPLP